MQDDKRKWNPGNTSCEKADKQSIEFLQVEMKGCGIGTIDESIKVSKNQTPKLVDVGYLPGKQ